MKNIWLICFVLLVASFAASPDVIYSESQGNYTLAVHNSGRVVSLKISPNEMNLWRTDSSGYNNDSMRINLTKTIYGFVKDSFDFIFFINNDSVKPSTIGYYGQLIGVKSLDQGISIYSTYDNSAQYGSSGALLSLMHMPFLSAIQNGPTLHELCHHWANFIKDFESAAPTGNYGSMPHWGWTGIPGQLGGFDPKTLVDLGGGNYQATNGVPGSTSFDGTANGGNGLPYANWELYLMGMMPVDSLYDIPYFTNVVTDDTLYAKGKFSGTKNTYTVSQFLIDRGSRLPAYGAAQTQFRVLFVVLSATDLTSQNWSDIAAQVNWLVYPGADQNPLYNFWEATRGKGTLRADMLGSLKNYSPSSSSVRWASAQPHDLQWNAQGIRWSQQGYDWSLWNLAGEQVQSGHTSQAWTAWVKPLDLQPYWLRVWNGSDGAVFPLLSIP